MSLVAMSYLAAQRPVEGNVEFQSVRAKATGAISGMVQKGDSHLLPGSIR
jgi:hypothetical protein